MITISCVLFVQMGLADAIMETLHVSLRLASCPKCLVFWASLVWLIAHENGLVVSVATSFIASYCALWLSLLYDGLALLYNYIYEEITNHQDTSEDAERPDSPTDIQADSDEVSQMPK